MFEFMFEMKIEKKKKEFNLLRIENIQSIKCCQMSVSSHKSFARKTNKN